MKTTEEYEDDYGERFHDDDETKSEAFTLLMTKRVNGVLRRMLPIAKLSSTNRYEFTREDIETHFSEIQKTLDVIKARFDSILDEKEIYVHLRK